MFTYFPFFLTFSPGTSLEPNGGGAIPEATTAAAEEIKRKLRVLNEARAMMANTTHPMSEETYNEASMKILTQKSD